MCLSPNLSHTLWRDARRVEHGVDQLHSHGGAACSGPLDCQLNGVCTAAGKCECGAAWTGGNCSRLNLLPATKGAGFYTADSSWSSWCDAVHTTTCLCGCSLRPWICYLRGNMVSRDPGSGKYYMAADEMANHCGAISDVLDVQIRKVSWYTVDDRVCVMLVQVCKPGGRTRAASSLRLTMLLVLIGGSPWW